MEIEDHLRALKDNLDDLKHHLTGDYKLNVLYDDMIKSYNGLKERMFKDVHDINNVF